MNFRKVISIALFLTLPFVSANTPAQEDSSGIAEPQPPPDVPVEAVKVSVDLSHNGGNQGGLHGIQLGTAQLEMPTLPQADGEIRSLETDTHLV